MEATDSRECRNCHSFEAMAFHEQGRRAAEKMQKAMDEGKSCIECHKGIAHKLPADFDDD
jgi:cytochrome c-type protein NapC